MALFLIIALVFALYLRTLKYNYVIDDNVRREGYMYDVPLISPPHDFFYTSPSPWYRLFMIGMHCVNVSIIYLLWGWAPALLFAVHPMSVWVTAWVTGNYYATATYFTLIAYYILHTFPNALGALVALPIFAAALNSTVCPINFPFLFLFVGPIWGLAMFFPLATYLTGKKFKTGIKIRFNINNDLVLREGKVKKNLLRRPAVMTKVMARYIFDILYPAKLGFFSMYGDRMNEDPKIWNSFHSYNKSFWCAFAVCVTTFTVGYLIHPVGIFWFFVLGSIHSQFNLTGQFYAQRYAYLMMVGLCVVVGTLLAPYPVVMGVVTTILVFRTFLYIPTWSNMEHVWRNDLETYPNANAYNNMAQFYLQKQQTLAPHIMNYVAYLLFKAEAMFPKAWEIQMNIACFFARAQQYDECLRRTHMSIALLEPLGGLPLPLDMLKKQVVDLTKLIADQKKAGAQTSPAQSQEGVNHDDKRTEKNEGTAEPSRGAELAGREA
jgi:hypothetical protein